MNQDEATMRVADALAGARGVGFDHVGILTPIPGVEKSVVIVRAGDTHLSVTVEILAQP
jgi:hypothetical protein